MTILAGRVSGMMLCLLAVLGVTAGTPAAPVPVTDDGWSEADAIRARVVAPTFPDRSFPITKFGAVGDGKIDAHPAIVKAIAACVAAGGGHVVVPAGVFLSNGPVHLRSNVDLHLEDGATLRFGGNPKDYLPVVLTRWEGILVYNYSPLVYANGETNVGVTGKGTIDGGGKEGFYRLFMEARGPAGDRLHEIDRQALWKMGAEKTPVEKRVFGEGHYLRPGGIEPFECTNVVIEGVTLTNMPFWVVHPIFCRNVTVRGIRVVSTTGNNDGCDPDSCTDVLIEDSYFETGDDAIAIKSGRDHDGRTVGRPSENIVIRRCTSRGRLYAFAIGSEMSGGVRNVFIEDGKALTGRAAVYVKGNRDRGGLVEHVRVRRIEAEAMTEAAVRFEANYHGYRGGNEPPTFRDVVVEEVHCRSSKAYGVYMEGQPDQPVRDVVLRNVVVDAAKVPLWIRHVKDTIFEGVKIGAAAQPKTPPMTPDDEKKLDIQD
jgi:polygalacturonase